ncbi:MAG: TIGR00730 family Rossman fold protein [Eubacterium sp.]|nr:TIGR00730 family Rossman fold protein [Eubacterium sp.]
MELCVFGAASKTIDEKYISAVEAMGEYLAQRGHNLVFGSGCTGSMGAAARGFKKGGGKTHGVIPTFFKEELSDFVDWHCDRMTYTETMRERKAVMEEAADAFIITPGGAGTFEEFFEVLTLKQLGRHRKPIALYNIDGYYDKLNEAMEYAIATEFIKPECRALYRLFDSVEAMAQYLENDNTDGIAVHDLK